MTEREQVTIIAEWTGDQWRLWVHNAPADIETDATATETRLSVALHKLANEIALDEEIPQSLDVTFSRPIRRADVSECHIRINGRYEETMTKDPDDDPLGYYIPGDNHPALPGCYLGRTLREAKGNVEIMVAYYETHGEPML